MLPSINSLSRPVQTNSTIIADSRSESSYPLLNKVRELVEQMAKLPGISADASADDVQRHRNNLLACLDTLINRGEWCCQQRDSSIRPVAVGLQAIFEHSLSSCDINGANVLYVTKNPLTPMCLPDILHTPSLFSDSVANHSASYDTVISRVKTVAEMLHNPSINICTIYSEKRADPRDQSVYDNVCTAYPNKNKFYSLCTGVPLPESYSGANYFITSKDNSTHLFGVRITQANQETDNCVVFIKDVQQRLKDLSENYLDVVQEYTPVDAVFHKYSALLRQNYS